MYSELDQPDPGDLTVSRVQIKECSSILGICKLDPAQPESFLIDFNLQLLDLRTSMQYHIIFKGQSRQYEI